MSKEFLLNTLINIKNDSYSWNLYFLKIDRRKRNPYFVFKHTFKKEDYLTEYISTLKDMIIRYQIKSLECVQNYDGENSKTSCDKINIHSELIELQWNELTESVAVPEREQKSVKYQGYILDGQPKQEGLPNIVIIKTGNPIITLDKKNSKVFKYTANNQLEQLTDELCHLYLSTDFMVIDDTLYTFNHNFEGIFSLEKTLHRLKDREVNKIMSANAFQDVEKVREFMNAYTSPKTFLTLNEQRMNKLHTPEGRVEIAERLKITTTDNKEFVLDSQEQVNQLIKYLCYKIFQDKETDKLIEVNYIVNDNVLI